jgi:CheY-like chemotaxis protein
MDMVKTQREIKILLLEDLTEDVVLIERALRKEEIRFELRCVDTRSEFIEQFHKFNPDVVLCDHSLPQMNSIEALKIKKDARSNVPFILVTGSVSKDFALNCLRQGANDFVLKSNLAALPKAIISSLKRDCASN